MPNDLLDPLTPATLRKRVRTLGHGLYKLSEAWKLLGVRLDRGLVDEATTAWIKRWSHEGWKQPLPLPVDSPALALLVWAGKAWQVEDLGEGEASAAWSVALLLLHLPALRDFWRKALRSQRYAWMSKALPQVWAVENQPLKPGTVIAGLGIGSWNELPRLMAKSGRAFELIFPVSGQHRPVAVEAWDQALAEAGKEPLLLREVFPLKPEGKVQASWRHDEAGRIGPGVCEPVAG